MTEQALETAAAHATRFLRGLAERPVAATAGAAELRARLGGPLPEHPSDPAEVVARLAELAEGGLVASAGPRYFGFVVGGSLPAALAADWLAAAWDQNAGLFVLGPAAATVEDVAAGWLLELLGLPPTATTGFVTGGLGANAGGLAAARHGVLAGAGWDVERDGLIGAPPVEVVVGAERHVTIDVALRYLGLGSGRVRVVPADDQGRMRADADTPVKMRMGKSDHDGCAASNARSCFSAAGTSTSSAIRRPAAPSRSVHAQSSSTSRQEWAASPASAKSRTVSGASRPVGASTRNRSSSTCGGSSLTAPGLAGPRLRSRRIRGCR